MDMPRIVIVILIYHRHKPIDLIYCAMEMAARCGLVSEVHCSAQLP
jgi:hypothetical protein